jgi:copper chaperone
MSLIAIHIPKMKLGNSVSVIASNISNLIGISVISIIPGLIIIKEPMMPSGIEKMRYTIERLGYRILRIEKVNSLINILNKMETVKFKTNIKCMGCVAQVSANMNELVGENNWEVDVNSTEKTLTVIKQDGITKDDVVSAVNAAGFKAEEA